MSETPALVHSRPASPGSRSPRRSKLDGQTPHLNRARAAKAAEAEAKILELVRDRPMPTGEIAKATASKVNTTGERLKRLKAKGLVVRDSANGGWAAG